MQYKSLILYRHSTDTTSISSTSQPSLDATSGDLTLRSDVESSATSLRSPLVHKATRCEDLQLINESTPINCSSGDDLQTSAFHFPYFFISPRCFISFCKKMITATLLGNRVNNFPLLSLVFADINFGGY